MIFKNSTYDILKDIALYVLPALATLILALGNIWGIPYAAKQWCERYQGAVSD